MAMITSSNCFARCVERAARPRWRAAAVIALVAATGLVLRDDPPAAACAWSDPSIAELTTFDPAVIGDATWDGLYFNPFESGYGGACDDCVTKAMLADWRGYLRGAVADADWQKVLFEATPADLAAIQRRLAGGGAAIPQGYERSSLWSAGAARGRLPDAIALVALARKVEPSATFDAYDADGNPARAPAPPAKLLVEAQTRLKTADSFLAQRYAFQALRILFYQRDFAAAIAFHDKNAATLVKPSDDLAWRARYYLAGALAHQKQLGRANLELARIHTAYPPLAGAAAEDFHPMEEADWRETLKLAADVREKTLLWRLVGIKSDGVVAMQEIIKLDPSSNLIALLAVRELAKAESLDQSRWGDSPTAEGIAAQKRAYAGLEQVAIKQAGTANADRRWLMELVAGHIAAKRGDLAAARAHLQKAVAARPKDPRVASQAKASLALALALTFDGKGNPQREDELAKTLSGLPSDFSRTQPVHADVRTRLAKAYAAANRLVDAEFLLPGTVEPIDDTQPTARSKWADVAFIKDMIARSRKQTSDFDKFVLAGSYTPPQLEQELALRYLVEGNYAVAAKIFQTTEAASGPLGTDPFTARIVDCHDCDHEKYANAPWTHASFAAKLAELAKVANGKGETAAAAALSLGNALYNITWYGNARVVFEGSHQSTRNTRPAEVWYERAFDLSKNRELKAKAAFLAAKAELGREISAAEDAAGESGDPAPVTVAKTWYPVIKNFADTKYHKEILAECGYYREWLRTAKKP